jgi:hypothetical protein
MWFKYTYFSGGLRTPFFYLNTNKTTDGEL